MPKIEVLLAHLQALYGDAVCALQHSNPFELAIATMLSAQCTDKRVNMVTPALFKRFPTPSTLATAHIDELEPYIASINFYHNKARALIGMAQALVQQHNSHMPRDIETLISLPGIARKTANVILGVGFGIAVGIVVDTHVARLSQRLGLTKQTSPEKIEQDLMRIVPQPMWILWSHMLIQHGRSVCHARKPACATCTLRNICLYNQEVSNHNR